MLYGDLIFEAPWDRHQHRLNKDMKYFSICVFNYNVHLLSFPFFVRQRLWGNIHQYLPRVDSVPKITRFLEQTLFWKSEHWFKYLCLEFITIQTITLILKSLILKGSAKKIRGKDQITLSFRSVKGLECVSVSTLNFDATC